MPLLFLGTSFCFPHSLVFVLKHTAESKGHFYNKIPTKILAPKSNIRNEKKEENENLKLMRNDEKAFVVGIFTPNWSKSALS
ncbi:CLUMA_CG008874, isoform A [Clunio marinus]|uniref:CLUMA_CG008874, isoform A n=1 Tax=Clunio marinus TaxID=568069 RepID=A0A1J1I4R3_9DIPT|nr:CLUMA_CG008874, isoform A [Clunio marinus]